MTGRKNFVPRKVMQEASEICVATNSIIEIETATFKVRVTPAIGLNHLAQNDDLDERLDGFA